MPMYSQRKRLSIKFTTPSRRERQGQSFLHLPHPLRTISLLCKWGDSTCRPLETSQHPTPMPIAPWKVPQPPRYTLQDPNAPTHYDNLFPLAITPPFVCCSVIKLPSLCMSLHSPLFLTPSLFICGPLCLFRVRRL